MQRDKLCCLLRIKTMNSSNALLSIPLAFSHWARSRITWRSWSSVRISDVDMSIDVSRSNDSFLVALRLTVNSSKSLKIWKGKLSSRNGKLHYSFLSFTHSVQSMSEHGNSTFPSLSSLQSAADRFSFLRWRCLWNHAVSSVSSYLLRSILSLSRWKSSAELHLCLNHSFVGWFQSNFRKCFFRSFDWCWWRNFNEQRNFSKSCMCFTVLLYQK